MYGILLFFFFDIHNFFLDFADKQKNCKRSAEVVEDETISRRIKGGKILAVKQKLRKENSRRRPEVKEGKILIVQ